MKRNLIILVTLIVVIVGAVAVGLGTRKQPRQDSITTPEGGKLTYRFFGHASIALKYADRWYYVDPVSQYVNTFDLPKADMILLTHHHADHFDTAAIRRLSTPQTVILAAGETGKVLTGKNVIPFRPGYKLKWKRVVKIKGVPAYNTTPSHLKFHPRGRGDCGYVINLGGLKTYVAGDSEDTPEMLKLKEIAVAFLPINQPFTMTTAQAERAVRAINPQIFYPYHYGGPKGKTDLSQLQENLEGTSIDMRIREME